MVFANIEYLFLLLLLIPYIVWYIMKRKNSELRFRFRMPVCMPIPLKAIRTICCMYRLYCG